MERFLNKILCGNALELLKQMPPESVDCVITSPPYAHRDRMGAPGYGTEPLVWDGEPSCRHEWGKVRSTLMHENRNNLRGSQEEVVGKTATAYIKKYDDRTSAFCAMCGAWRGELGLEPTFHLYIKHLCDIFDEAKRVLKKTGSCWAVMGDTYWSAKGSCCNPGGGANSIETPKKNKGAYPLHRGNRSDIPYLKPKSLCLIPSRSAIEMCNRGWVLRNGIIWHKRNCMPCSARDRFTVDFESVYFFVKSRRYFFEQQFEPIAAGSVGRYNYGFGGGKNELITIRSIVPTSLPRGNLLWPVENAVCGI